MTHKLYLCMAVAVLLNLSKAVKVSDTVCTKESGTECTDIGHAECDNADSDAKCKCSDGYKEDSGNGSTCVKVPRVTETVCTKDTGTECSAIDHAVCDNADSNAKCKCSDGYREDSGDGSTCVKVPRVTETVCTKDTGTECSAIDHAVCDNAASNAKCKCSDGYKEDSGDGSTCVKVPRVTETVCTKDTGTECSAIDHAVCDNADSNAKCKCSDGYKEDSGDGSTCVKVPRVTETVCTKDTGTECSAIDHAVCDNADSNAKCKCSDGYKEDSGDGSTCVKVKVSETVCTKDSGTECSAIDHAVCDNAVSNAKCKCSDGYKEDSGNGSTCVKGEEGNSAPSVVQAACMISMSLFVTVFQKLL